MRAFGRGEDGYGVLLGMAAFGLEECGDYFRAETYGKEAVSIDPRDGWAVHAVAHVNEMRGDLEAGIPWLADTADQWAPDSGFSYHNFWHLGLLYLDKGDIGLAIVPERHPWDGPELSLQGSGESISVGEFLNRDDTLKLAALLREEFRVGSHGPRGHELF